MALQPSREAPGEGCPRKAPGPDPRAREATLDQLRL